MNEGTIQGLTLIYDRSTEGVELRDALVSKGYVVTEILTASSAPSLRCNGFTYFGYHDIRRTFLDDSTLRELDTKASSKIDALVRSLPAGKHEPW